MKAVAWLGIDVRIFESCLYRRKQKNHFPSLYKFCRRFVFRYYFHFINLTLLVKGNFVGGYFQKNLIQPSKRILLFHPSLFLTFFFTFPPLPHTIAPNFKLHLIFLTTIPIDKICCFFFQYSSHIVI